MDDAVRPLKAIKRVPDHSVAAHRVPQCDMAGRGKKQNKRKIGAYKSIPEAKGKRLAYAAAFIETIGFCFSWSATDADRLSTKTRIAEG